MAAVTDTTESGTQPATKPGVALKVSVASPIKTGIYIGLGIIIGASVAGFVVLLAWRVLFGTGFRL